MMNAGSSYTGPWLGPMNLIGYFVTFSMFFSTWPPNGIMISA